MEIIEIDIPGFDPLEFFLKTSEKATFFRTENWFTIAWNPSSNLDRPHREHQALPFCGGIIGYMSYDGVMHANSYDDFLCFDSESKRLFTSVPDQVREIWDCKLGKRQQDFGLNFKPQMSEDDYNSAFDRIKEYILAGDIYQVNLTYPLDADFDGDHRDLFAKICEVNPAPFSAYLEFDDHKILSASPERFLKLENGLIQTCPVKGTKPRGQTPEEDEKLKQELINSDKETAELNMITDLLRNDIGQVSEIGTVRVVRHRAIQQCPTVWHTYSLIEGVLRSDLNAMDLLKSCMPGGSITGCPKKRAMEIIDELEPSPRGAYTGSVFYISDCGNMDSSIIIRTIVARDGKLRLNVGGGIVADSKNDSEYQETLDKAKSFLNL